MLFIKTLFVLYLTILASGQEFFTGECPQATTITNFSAKDYMGKWFEITRYEAKFQAGGECTTAEYSLLANNTVEVKNSQISKDGEYSVLIGNAREANPGKNDGKLKVLFPVRENEGDYWILGTDYVTYSVVWSCNQLGPKNMQFLWILSRRPTLTDVAWKTVDEILNRNGVDKSKTRPTMTKHDEKTCANKPDHFKY